MMDYVRDGDTVVVESISRFARSARDFLDLMERLSEKDVAFISKKESIDTMTPAGRFMLMVFAAVAELEREYIRDRQREGIEIARSKGKYKGKRQIPPLCTDAGVFDAYDYRSYLQNIKKQKAVTVNTKLAALISLNDFLVETDRQRADAISKKDLLKKQAAYTNPSDLTEKDVEAFRQAVLLKSGVRDYAMGSPS